MAYVLELYGSFIFVCSTVSFIVMVWIMVFQLFQFEWTRYVHLLIPIATGALAWYSRAWSAKILINKNHTFDLENEP